MSGSEQESLQRVGVLNPGGRGLGYGFLKQRGRLGRTLESMGSLWCEGEGEQLSSSSLGRRVSPGTPAPGGGRRLS